MKVSSYSIDRSAFQCSDGRMQLCVGQYCSYFLLQMAGRVPALVMMMKMGSGWMFITRLMKTQEKW